MLTLGAVNIVALPILTLVISRSDPGSTTRIMLAACLLAFLANAAYSPVMIFLNERYPTAIRSRGTAVSWKQGNTQLNEGHGQGNVLLIFAPDRLRHEVGKLIVASECDMHLGDTPAGLRHVAQIRDLILALPDVLARRQQALLVDEAVEIGRGHGPGVALIGDESMQDPDSVSLVTINQFDAAEQCRRVGKAATRSGSVPSRSRD